MSATTPINLTQLSDEQMNPLSSPDLNSTLPGLARAFDEDAMRHELASALLGAGDASSIVECEVEQATFLAQDSVLVRYAVSIARGNGDAYETVVSGQLFPDQASCDAYVTQRLQPAAELMAGRDEIALFAHPVASLDMLHMAVYAWPIDADLPELVGATDGERMTQVFADVLPAAQSGSFTPAMTRVELVDYGRARRATLRYRISGQTNGSAAQEIIYGKVTGDGSGAMADGVVTALRQRLEQLPAEQRYAIPSIYAWIPDIKLSLLETIPGQAELADMIKARVRGKAVPETIPSAEELVAACGRIAATLHTSGIALGPRRTFEDELAALRREAAPIQQLSPELGDVIEPRLQRLEREAARTAALPLCFNHGDFTHGQVLSNGHDSGLIDFDSVCQAEPALDLGQFLTYLRLAATKSKLSRTETDAIIDDLSEHFLGGYLAVTGDNMLNVGLLRTRVALYRKISLLRRINRSWQKFKVNRIMGAVELIDQLDA